MKRIVKPQPGGGTTQVVVHLSSEVSYEDLLGKTKEAIRREVVHLLGASATGKLDNNSARDLVNYAKFLSEMTEKEVEAAANMSEDELKRIANRDKKAKKRERKRLKEQQLDEDKHTSSPESIGQEEIPVP